MTSPSDEDLAPRSGSSGLSLSTGSGGSAANTIVVDGLSVRYIGRKEPALDAVGVRVEAGQVIGVAGRTGAGKSTLALVCGGFIPRVVKARVGGSASVAGVGITTANAAQVAGRVGIIFSTPAHQLSASKLTVREELAFGLENLAVPRSEMDERIDAVLAELGITQLADRAPLALSGGEQQRVAIASILVMGARVLVLDEPTAQLDPAGTATVTALLRQTADGGSAVLCVEQEPTVLGSTDGCLLLEGGRGIGFDLAAVALGSAALRPLAMLPPTAVRLAEVAGVAPADAFDESAVAIALAAVAASAPASLQLRSSAPAISLPEMPGPGAGSGGGIVVRGLVHRYPGGLEAVRGIDLTIAPGERVAIVGQNGSGKTTLVKHLNGLLGASSGLVSIDGQDVAGIPVSTLAQTVGFVFQNPDDQLFERSVEREVGFGPRNLRLDAARAAKRVERSLAIVDLVAERTTNPYDLGPSRRKLVALASVLALEPTVLVLDEPTAGQDWPGVARVGAIVEAWAGVGRTVVAITHDMEFAARHFGRIVVMREGLVALDGPPEEVFAPQHAALLASTGLTPPPVARIAALLGLARMPPTAEGLLVALRAGASLLA